MRGTFLITVFLLLLMRMAMGQLSQGGGPLNVSGLKSGGVSEICMPSFDLQTFEAAGPETPGDLMVKPFRFAYGFDVDISPKQDGCWFYDINGYDVWKVTVRSAGAYSLNLVFDEFHLPSGARLFLFNEQKGHLLGAFTSRNNKVSKKFAVSPVAGEALTVQYEVPAGTDGRNDFVIREVGHDFVGVVKNERRPMNKTAGSCNIDIYCDLGSDWYDVKDATCRIIINKSDQPGNPREFCTGTLINNTEEDGKPYILTAAHCFDKEAYVETSIFTFNYESPYCAPLDGDPSNSISGATLRAFSDSLDFALVELTVVPPPEFRCYYAGWDRRRIEPDSSISIHHPMGDIKKIAVDRDPAVFSDFSSEYTPGGFHHISRWEEGVTEAGSSGGGLFSFNKLLIGSLTGGAANCFNPVDDYFSRFDRAWEYRPDSSQQLKYWLDPSGKNFWLWLGKRIYPTEDVCLAFTNLEDYDSHQNVVIRDQGIFAGYWGGSNHIGISEFAERFTLPGRGTVHGISVGAGKIKLSNPGTDYALKVKVYEGDKSPERLIYSEDIGVRGMVAGVMNYIGFAESVQVPDTFFVGFELLNFSSQDTFVVLQSQRPPEKPNFYWYKEDQRWHNIRESTSAELSMVSVLELIACGISGIPSDTPVVANESDVWVYPNPANRLLTIESAQPFATTDIQVVDLLGREVDVVLKSIGSHRVQVDLMGNLPGTYLLRLKSKTGMVSYKVQLIP